jgi:hypothetical protein
MKTALTIASLFLSLLVQNALCDSTQIDRLVEQEIARENEQSLPPVTDEEFLRRLYLGVVGRIPTHDEARSFLDKPEPRLRADLIEELLNSDGYVSHSFNWWADILRIRSSGSPAINASGASYANWVKKSIAENTPYDQFVRELINPIKDGEEAYTWDNGAAGYYMRDSGMPLDNMSNTVQVFMGTRLVCAQCHDHPFDKWSQMDYHQMAAYRFNTITTRTSTKSLLPTTFDKNKDTPFFRQAANDVFRPIQYGVVPTERKHKLPHDYRSKRKGGKPGEEVRPSTRGFKDAPPGKGGKGQHLLGNYAEWLTHRDNVRFNRVIANRLWKRVFGRGLVEPVDNWTDETEASNRYLMDYLTRLIVQLNYDQKEFLKILLNTRTYQRQAYGNDISGDDKFLFTGPVLRRMSAEQIYDSIGALSKTIDTHSPPTPNTNNIAETKAILELNETARVEMVKKVAAALQEHSIAVKKVREEGGDGMRKKITELNKARDKKIREAKPMVTEQEKPSKPTGFVRSSGLQSPAPNGHFLRSFGQSDRTTIENAEIAPSVDQALLLLNSNAVTGIFNDNLEPDQLFLSIMTRYPTEEEMKFLEGQSNQDLGWSLVNTQEFIFIK